MRQEDLNEIISNSCPSWMNAQITKMQNIEEIQRGLRDINSILVANLFDHGDIHLNQHDAAKVLTIVRQYI